MEKILRHSFSRLKFNNQPRCLVSLNRLSYGKFLKDDKSCCYSIDNALESVFPIHDTYGYATIEYVGNRMVEPKYSIEECRVKNLSYASSLYITVRLILFDVDTEKKTRRVKMIKEQELYLCDVPIMTENDSFIVDGVEKIVVSQIHKTPGVFFNKKIKDDLKFEYSATIVPYLGSRLEFLFSSKTSLYFRIDKHRKISIYHLLSALKMSQEEMVSNLYEPLKMSVEGNNVFSFENNFSDYIGSTVAVNVRNEKGDILIKKGSIIGRLFARKFGKQTKFYCNSEDLCGQFLFSPVYCKRETFRVASVLDKNMLELIQDEHIKDFVIVNSSTHSFNECVLNAINENYKIDSEMSLSMIMKVLRPGAVFVTGEAESFFNNMFFSESNYSLMDVGRYKLNSVLEINVPSECVVLTKDDIVASIKKLMEFKNGFINVDDIDSLSNRRIKSIGELVYTQFRNAIVKMAKGTVERLNSIVLDTTFPSDCMYTNQVAKFVRDFFLLSELCQFMEQTNLLSELAHIRKVSALGNGGITRDRATADVRDIHPTHYGRICPIETPDGRNIGLVTSLSSYARINKYGFIETPYRKVVNGEITDQIDYLDANEEKKYKISCASYDIVSLPSDSDKLVTVRYNEDFTMVPRKDIDYIDVAPCQITSMMASFIPFLESNDTARALMGSNMQRQAVPLLFKEAPYIATGFESEVVKEANVVVKAKNDGEVVFVDANNLLISVDGKNEKAIDCYKLKTFSRTNQNTFSNQNPVVALGEKVKKGQVIADCASTNNGEVAIGKNILLAFVPWNGYNYEDSVVISRRLVSEDKFTSVHIEEFEVLVRDTAVGAEETTRDIDGVSDEKLKYLDETGIVQIGVNVSAGDILVGKVTPNNSVSNSAEERLLKAIFGDKIAQKRDTSLHLPSGTFGTVVDVKILTRRGNLKDQRALQIERDSILKRETQKNIELSVLNEVFNENLDLILDGSFVTLKGKKNKLNLDDLKKMRIEDKFNLSVESDISKKVFELKKLYFASKKRIESLYIKDVEKLMDGDDLPNGVLKVVKVYVAVKSRLQPGDKIAGRHGNKGVISRCVAVEDMPYMEDGTPIDLIFSPVSVPGRMNIGQILETHLGFISYNIGKKIDDALNHKDASDRVREILLDVSQSEDFTKEVKKRNDEQILELGKQYRNGLFFETPVFDGCKIENMDRLADRLGIDKSLQVTLYNGLTGEPFDRKVTVGYMYIIKLHHLVDEKMHARSTGPYSLITQQPLGGRAYFGGQRLGEMECWALQAYGAAYTLQEMLTVKSDDVAGREKMYEAIINNDSRFESGIPESFNVLCRELRSLGFDIELGVNG